MTQPFGRRWAAVEIALFPIALLGFAAMVAFYVMYELIGMLIMSPMIDRIALAIVRLLPPETAHNMAIRYLKMTKPFLK